MRILENDNFKAFVLTILLISSIISIGVVFKSINYYTNEEGTQKAIEMKAFYEKAAKENPILN